MTFINQMFNHNNTLLLHRSNFVHIFDLLEIVATGIVGFVIAILASIGTTDTCDALTAINGR